MELFKGLTQEEYKQLRYEITYVGLLIEYKQDWKEYLFNILQSNISFKLYEAITNLFHKSNTEIDTVIQGILYEKNY